MSALDPAGPGASSISAVWWAMFWGSMAILALMTALGLYSVFGSPAARERVSSRALVIGGGVVFPLITILGLLAYGVHSGHALLPLATDREVFRVEVTAHRWWWDVTYPDVGGETFREANEIHIPAGRPVNVVVRTDDVIHSFWVPRLGGKIDAIPGIANTIRIEADEPGVFRGQCAEFCGAQHSRMGFHVVAHEEADFAARFGALAPPPAAAGEDAFVSACAACHSVDPGDTARALGPNLATLDTRGHLGAGWLPNTPENLRRWLREHQAIKPGNAMPDFAGIDDDMLDAIAAYLEASR